MYKLTYTLTLTLVKNAASYVHTEVAGAAALTNMELLLIFLVMVEQCLVSSEDAACLVMLPASN